MAAEITSPLELQFWAAHRKGIKPKLEPRSLDCSPGIPFQLSAHPEPHGHRGRAEGWRCTSSAMPIKQLERQPSGCPQQRELKVCLFFSEKNIFCPRCRNGSRGPQAARDLRASMKYFHLGWTKKWMAEEHFKYNYLHCSDQYLRNDVTYTKWHSSIQL